MRTSLGRRITVWLCIVLAAASWPIRLEGA
jgi:hypothetical protein